MRKKIIYNIFAVLMAGMLVLSVHANMLPFVPYETQKLLGDVNGDEAVNACDQALLCLYFAGYPVDIEEMHADVDLDGRVSRRDAMILARFLAEWEDYTLPYQK